MGLLLRVNHRPRQSPGANNGQSDQPLNSNGHLEETDHGADTKLMFLRLAKRQHVNGPVQAIGVVEQGLVDVVESSAAGLQRNPQATVDVRDGDDGAHALQQFCEGSKHRQVFKGVRGSVHVLDEAHRTDHLQKADGLQDLRGLAEPCERHEVWLHLAQNPVVGDGREYVYPEPRGQILLDTRPALQHKHVPLDEAGRKIQAYVATPKQSDGRVDQLEARGRDSLPDEDQLKGREPQVYEQTRKGHGVPDQAGLADWRENTPGGRARGR
mmetsp:Transcript_17942/g.62989  ORF Transcript_17942/g.62989 Transcript_17942/m.62989 type:complete len:269 (+) Transcript_17942:632-1438(+)